MLAHASTLTHPPLPTLSKPCRHPGCPVAAAAPKNGVSTTDDGGHGITVPSVTEYIIPPYINVFVPFYYHTLHVEPQSPGKIRDPYYIR